MAEPVCERCGWVKSNHKGGPAKKGFCTEFVDPGEAKSDEQNDARPKATDRRTG